MMNESATLASGGVQRTLRGDFVVLRADEMSLIVPQSDVEDLEYIGEHRNAHTERGVLSFGSHGHKSHAIALSKNMGALLDFPPDRFLLTRLTAGAHQFLLAWNEVRVLPDAQITVQPLPPSLRSVDGPIEGYVEENGRVLLYTNAASILQHLHVSARS